MEYDFGEIFITETENFESFDRKKLIKIYNKYNDIMIAFKHNKLYWCFDGEVSRHILTKRELQLIHKEIDKDTYKYKTKEESRYALLKYYHKEVSHCVVAMKEIIDVLPQDIKTTRYECQCGSNVLMSHKARHLKSLIHTNFINKVSPKPKAETTVECGCGKKYTSNNKSHHDKTRYHLDWLGLID